MNERIKELFEQAYGGEWPTDITNIAPSELERFAKLIIQECIKICDKVQIKYGQYTFTARICKEDIKEHFGVEE
jgi:hypothetical protein